MNCCFLPTDILLPHTSFEKWAVIACDQFTSSPNYWETVKNTVGDNPSALNLIFPEVYLNSGDTGRIKKITQHMKQYISDGVLAEEVKNGFVYVERETAQGTRHGIIGALDLEAYDYAPGTDKPVRATEGTVLSRIPPRLKIRESAIIEIPHVMVLINDVKRKIVEPLQAKKTRLRKLYDFDLMLGGGHIAGWAVDGADARELAQIIATAQSECSDFFIAMGDGNHSLATAKADWEKVKKTLAPDDKPLKRYSLVEMVDLNDTSLVFEPIHRAVFNADFDEFHNGFMKYIKEQDMTCESGSEITFLSQSRDIETAIGGKNGLLPVGIIQNYIDDFLHTHKDASVDYIHGEPDVRRLAESGAIGILLEPFAKSALFPAVAAGGVLPRKTFSMGEARDKRYYIEARAIGK